MKQSSLEIEKLSLQYAGKLLLRNEIDLDETTLQQLLKNKNFQSTPPIINKKFHVQCMRCGNEKKHLFATIPCYLCKNDHLYCRHCIELGRVSQCEPLYIWKGETPKWQETEQPCTWEGKLTNVQENGAKRIMQAIINQEKELLVWSVTGSGKTEMIFPGITQALKQGYRICIATPRVDVVRELLPRLQQAFLNIPIQGLYGGSKDKQAPSQLVIATTHQLIRYQEAFDLIIVDEVDAFPYHADPSLLYVTKRSLKKDGTVVYLTATPRAIHRSQVDQKELAHIFVPTRYHGYPLPVPQMKMSYSLQKSLQSNLPPKSLITYLKNRVNKERQLLLFVPTIQLAEAMKVNLANALVKENLITNENSLVTVHSKDSEREEKINRFRRKETFILLTTTILERGVTFPSIDVVVLDAGHDIFDEAALVQIAGRAGRSKEDPTGEVIFMHDGKTKAIVRAIQSIKMMNKRGGFT